MPEVQGTYSDLFSRAIDQDDGAEVAEEQLEDVDEGEDGGEDEGENAEERG